MMNRRKYLLAMAAALAFAVMPFAAVAHMRTTLAQCTVIAIRYSGYLNSFYQRIKVRRGFGKAIIATARKLLKIIYNTLKNGWIFEGFTQFETIQNQCTTDNHHRRETCWTD